MNVNSIGGSGSGSSHHLSKDTKIKDLMALMAAMMQKMSDATGGGQSSGKSGATDATGATSGSGSSLAPMSSDAIGGAGQSSGQANSTGSAGATGATGLTDPSSSSASSGASGAGGSGQLKPDQIQQELANPKQLASDAKNMTLPQIEQLVQALLQELQSESGQSGDSGSSPASSGSNNGASPSAAADPSSQPASAAPSSSSDPSASAAQPTTADSSGGTLAPTAQDKAANQAYEPNADGSLNKNVVALDDKAAQKYSAGTGLSAADFSKVLQAQQLHESGGNPDAVSPTNSNGTTDYGIAQINSTNLHGENPFNVNQSVDKEASMLSQGIKSTGSLSGGLEQYNSGSATGAPQYASAIKQNAGVSVA